MTPKTVIPTPAGLSIAIDEAQLPREMVSVARLDLPEEIRQMRTSVPPGGRRHLSKTLIRTADVRLVLMVLESGARIDEHKTEGRMTIQGIDGHVRVRSGESTFDLAPGQLLVLDRDVPHALQAVEESSILLTITWHGHHSHA
jgi:quercetin dioxygenase-like cupin family protein